MTNKNTDTRVIRTKRLIRNALTELILEKGFEEITISNLTDKAKINRSTFYLHYRDKYDLIEQSEDDILKEIEWGVRSKQLKLSDTLNHNQRNEPNPLMIVFFELLMKHSDFIRVNLGPKGSPLFQNKLKELLKKFLLVNITEKLFEREFPMPEEYITAYIISAHLGVIQHWLDTGMKKTPREMSLILSKTTFWNSKH